MESAGRSCSVLTPSPKKNIDSFRNGMGETNEALADDDGGGERRRSEGGVREQRRGEGFSMMAQVGKRLKLQRQCRECLTTPV